MIEGKKEKLLRDKLDYEKNNNYSWKKMGHWNRYDNQHVKKRETKFAEDTLAVTV